MKDGGAMIEVKPNINQLTYCDHCGQKTVICRLIWQGIHICVETRCEHCKAKFIEDLRVGHATHAPYKIALPQYTLVGEENSRKWLGEPLRKSLQQPASDLNVSLQIVQNIKTDKVIIINCIDYLYGHSLLKLLNAQREYEDNKSYGIIVLVQKALEWMVPDFVAEKWVVNIPFSKARNFYPKLDQLISEQISRFEEICVSRAYSHPSQFNIAQFTGVSTYNRENGAKPRITFVWREDRFWLKYHLISKIVQKYPKFRPYFIPFIYYQQWKVIRLYKRLKRIFPDYLLTVAGLGKTGSFPSWIEDHRVKAFTKESEYETCKLYSESQVVIGIHGSNMLLPSAHAGLTIDIMPMDRWGNFAQDILFQEEDSRIASYKYRFIPIQLKIESLSKIIKFQSLKFEHYTKQMKEERYELEL